MTDRLFTVLWRFRDHNAIFCCHPEPVTEIMDFIPERKLMWLASPARALLLMICEAFIRFLFLRTVDGQSDDGRAHHYIWWEAISRVHQFHRKLLLADLCPLSRYVESSPIIDVTECHESSKVIQADGTLSQNYPKSTCALIMIIILI